MSKQLIICFTCKNVKSKVTVGGCPERNTNPSLTCQFCNEEMKVFNNHIKVPKKNDSKGWKQFERQLKQNNGETHER